jgi:hypothetical protein
LPKFSNCFLILQLSKLKAKKRERTRSSLCRVHFPESAPHNITARSDISNHFYNAINRKVLGAARLELTVTLSPETALPPAALRLDIGKMHWCFSNAMNSKKKIPKASKLYNPNRLKLDCMVENKHLGERQRRWQGCATLPDSVQCCPTLEDSISFLSFLCFKFTPYAIPMSSNLGGHIFCFIETFVLV